MADPFKSIYETTSSTSSTSHPQTPSSLWPLLAVVSVAGTASFLTLSAMEVGVVPLYLNKTDAGASWFTPATPNSNFLYVMAGVGALAVAWVLQLLSTLSLRRAVPFYIFWCLCLSAWNATSLLEGVTGRVVDACCMAGALVGGIGVYAGQRAWRTVSRVGVYRIADVFASASVVVTAFGVGVLGIVVLHHVEGCDDCVLSPDIQNIIPNVIATATAMTLALFARDLAAPIAAAACAITQGRYAVAVIVCVLDGVLFIYALARRSLLCK